MSQSSADDRGRHRDGGTHEHETERRSQEAEQDPVATLPQGASSLVGGCPFNRYGAVEVAARRAPRCFACARISERMRSSRGSVSRSTKRHRRGDRRVDPRDLRVQRVRDGAVGRVALAARAQLDQVHRLARVHVEHVADPVAEAERVGRQLRPAELDGCARTRRASARARRGSRRPRRPRSSSSGHARAEVGRRASATGRSACGGAGGRGRRRSRRRPRSGSGAPRSRGRAGGGGCARSPTSSASICARSSGGSARTAPRASSSEHRRRLEQQRGQQVVLAAAHGQQPHRRARRSSSRAAVEPEPRGPALGRLARARSR